MSYHQPPPATTTTPTPATCPPACPRGGSCFLPRLLAKIPPILCVAGGSFLYESERIFFCRFLSVKTRVLGFRRGKTLFARPRVWSAPFCARVSAIFFTYFYRTKCVFGGFVEVKWPFLWLGLQKCRKTRGFLLLGPQTCSKIRGSLALGLPKCFKIHVSPSLGLQKCRKIRVFLSP